MRRSRSVIALFSVLMLVVPALALLDQGPVTVTGPSEQEELITGAGTYWDEESTPYHQGFADQSWSYETISDLTLNVDGLSCGVGSSGYLISHTVSIAREKVWDYAYAEVALNAGKATLEVRDPDSGTYPSTTVIASVVADAPADVLAIDLREVDVETYPDLHLVVVLEHPGSMTSPPVLVSWRLGQQDADLWHDPFYGQDRYEDRGHLWMTPGMVRPFTNHIWGGILGDYYDSLGFTNFELTRLDQTIDFDWGNGAPAGGMGANRFSIRWEGKMYFPADDTYTLYLRIDDGGRLWVDGEQLIDEWRDQSPTEFSGSKYLTAGLHDLRIDYYENGGGASCRFRWSSSTFSKQTVSHMNLWGRNATNVLISEEIVLPEGHNWDYMTVSKYSRGDPVYIDILDGTTDTPIPGYVNLQRAEMDLRSVPSGSYPSIKLRARWPDGVPINSSVIEDWAIKWIPERTWRCEFLTDLRVAGSVGMMMESGYARAGVAYDTTDLMAFARTSNSTVPIYDSTVWRKSYFSQDLPTSNATDVAVADMDGDGIGDVIFTHADRKMNATAFRGTTKGFSSAPTWTFAHSPYASDSALFWAVVVEDINGDGGADVILAEHNQTSISWWADNILIYIWNGSGWNSTPDRVIQTGRGIPSLDAGDIDGDGWADLVFSLKGNRLQSDDTYVLWGSADGYGYDDKEKISNGAARGIIVDFLNSDEYEDVGYLRSDSVYVHYGSSSGISSTPDYQLDIPAPTALTFADWNGDGHRDVVITSSSTVQIHLHPFGTSPSDFITLDFIKDGIAIDTVRVGTTGGEGLVVGTRDRPSSVSGNVHVTFKMGSVISTHSIPMDGVVAVAAGEMFPMGVHTLRTALIDVGDVGDVGNWSHFNYRMALNSPTSDQSMEVRLVDAATEEILWFDIFTDAEGSVEIAPNISAREHPKVYLDVFAKNHDDWNEMYIGHLEINWTKRVPRAPRTISIEADDPSIYRTNSTTLHVVAEDEFDLSEDLVLNVQMQTPDGSGWVSDRLSIPVWDGEGWAVVFDTTRDDPVGAYSFRARAIDSDMLGSEYLEAEDLVTVINNPPGAPSIAITPASPGTGDDLKCEILRQALDRDTSHLDYGYEWYIDGQVVPGVDGDNVPANMTSKGQVWRVEVTAFDGMDHGGTVEAVVTIANSPPTLVKPLGKVLMLEDDPQLVIRLADHFADPDGDTLVYTLEGSPAVTIEVNEGRLVIDLPADWHGTTDVWVNVTDGEFSLLDNFVIVVESIPDPPVVISIGGKGPVNGRFYLDATQDVETAYLVVVEDVDSTRFRFGSDGKFTRFQVVAGNGTIIFNPTNAEVGDVSFNLSVLDDMNSIIVPVDVAVADVNDPPGPVTIQQPKLAMVFEHDATILLKGTCSDPDERHGQALFYTWISDLDGDLGQGTSIQVKDLTAGEHRITLEVTDGVETRGASVRIVVKAAPDDNGGGGGGGPDDDPFIPVSGESMLPFILLAILVIVIVAIAVLYRTKLRPGKDVSEEGFFLSEDEKEGVKMVEGIPMSMLADDHTGEDGRPSSTDMRSVILGTPTAGKAAGEEIPASPWSADDLRTPTTSPTRAPAPPAASAQPTTSRVVAAAAGWEEAPDEPPPTAPPPPPPPPPAVAQAPPSVPTPPPPGVPQRSGSPRKRPPVESEWEEVQ